MTVMAAAFARYGIQNGRAPLVLCIIQQSPGALQRGGAEIVLVARHRIAGGVTDGAIDALDPGIGRLTLNRRFIDRRDGVVAGQRAVVNALSFDPFVEERVHIDREVFDDRQISQRADGHGVAVQNL